ncbi:MAG TPA: cutinase family protein [Mycobacterium sp.]|nr:cutinase family protein [Mycobacterium sp.]
MNTRRILRPLGVALALTWLLQSTAVTPPSAAAEPCPDVEALFARGTDEAPGLGDTGQAFVNALRPRLGERSLEVYAVNYPATNDWPTGVQGIRDASSHIQATAANCPKTKMVLSGFSQGAAVMGFATANAIPDGVDGTDVPQPMPPEMADHVAAVVLFGTPNERAMNFLGQPSVVIGPAYTAKTIQLCMPEDPVCSEGLNFSAHAPGAYDGIAEEGAAYAANRL